jgi:hypothetical protein
MDIWIAYFRELLHNKIGLIDFCSTAQAGGNCTIGQIMNNIQKICRAKRLLSKNINVKLLVENLILSLKTT